MRKQEIIDYNKVNLEKLSEDDRKTILYDYTETEPYYFKGNLDLSWYNRMPGGEYVLVPCKHTKYTKYTKYTCTVLASDGNMWQFGFSNRSRLRNIIKKIQSINDNIIAKVIAIQEV